MNIIVGFVIATAIACAAPSRSAGSAVDDQLATAADSIRGHQLAELIDFTDTTTRIHIAPGILPPPYPQETRDVNGQYPEGEVTVAFIVEVNGHVMPGSRTLIMRSGTIALDRAVCRFLLTARFEWTTGKPERAAAFMPFVFSMGHASGAEKGDVARGQRRLMTALRGMTLVERERWLAGNPGCDSL